MAFPNVYTHRKVAETKAKSCDICFKLSSSVLITPDNKDWFYVCPAHLKDSGFCTPKVDTAAIEARKKRELDEEIERVKKEYEEKQRKKKEKQEKGQSGDNKDEKEEKKDTDDKPGEDGKKTQRKTNQGSKNDADAAARVEEENTEEEPRVFELRSTFYQQRLNKKRQAEIARRNRERLQDPTFFPSVPKNLPS
ncbi:7faa1837-63ea-4474-aaaa-2b525d434eeb [Thermothielavioides terrestris]|uniref:7faa1837-63ea-4474-aaaa-2b525d434eeb n=1 Tax=Thermothielavioides terrestris TaxID=2587410 RepID=A0A3S4C8L3_9PEZI|nr:7faa1837-63ea-4474-aaaa-2b525d434eeb [Thermothielavioides terrestris]